MSTNTFDSQSSESARVVPGRDLVVDKPRIVDDLAVFKELARVFLGKRESRLAELIVAHPVYSRALELIKAAPGDFGQVEAWAAITFDGDASTVINSFKDAIVAVQAPRTSRYAKAQRKRLRRWKREATEREGACPIRIAHWILLISARRTGDPGIAYFKETWWTYDKEPVWRGLPEWDSVELVNLVRRECDRWNRQERKRHAASGLKGKPPRITGLQATNLVATVRVQLKALASIGRKLDMVKPFWIQSHAPDPEPSRIIALNNGLLDITIPDKPALLQHTPRFFSPILLPFDYESEATPPDAFLGLIDHQFGKRGDPDEDVESKDALLEFFALCLIPELKYQRFLILKGRPGTGRSTLVEVLCTLLGDQNHENIDVGALDNQHAKASLVGKLLVTFNDSRTSDSGDATRMLQFILQVVGGDRQHMNPKYKSAYTARLLARVIMVTNLLPNFRDITGAIERRLLLVSFDRMVTKEDQAALKIRLGLGHGDILQYIKENELPGILNLLLAKLGQLDARGDFVQPHSSSGDVFQIVQDATTVYPFVMEQCEFDPDFVTPVQVLYDAYFRHARNAGNHPLNLSHFGVHLQCVCDRLAKQVRRVRATESPRPWLYRGIRALLKSDLEQVSSLQDILIKEIPKQ
jgi:putative DNA primase/helicase